MSDFHDPFSSNTFVIQTPCNEFHSQPKNQNRKSAQVPTFTLCFILIIFFQLLQRQFFEILCNSPKNENFNKPLLFSHRNLCFTNSLFSFDVNATSDVSVN